MISHVEQSEILIVESIRLSLSLSFFLNCKNAHYTKIEADSKYAFTLLQNEPLIVNFGLILTDLFNF